MSDLYWTNVAVRLGDLKPWARNPKTISKRNAERLLRSWDEMGQFQTVAIGPDGEVYDGHQRLSVLLAARGPEYMIDARQSNRALTEDERAKLVLSAHVGTTGQWDWDALSGWDETLLQYCGFDAALLKELNDDAANLRELLTLLKAQEGMTWDEAAGRLPDQDRAPFQQMTFTLHDTQVERVKTALATAKGEGAFDSLNENSNGNALARICEAYLMAEVHA